MHYLGDQEDSVLWKLKPFYTVVIKPYTALYAKPVQPR